MKILLIEDDFLVCEDLATTFTERHPTFEVTYLETEWEFREKFAELESSPPDLIIMDVMLPWDRPRPDIQLPPEDIAAEGFHTAGVRIYRMLESSPALSATPVIFHSASDTEYLRQALGQRPPHVLILPKTSASAEELLLSIRSLLPSHDYSGPPPKDWWQRLYDALEIKLGGFGIRIDVKKLK